jgi:hypothetical protein
MRTLWQIFLSIVAGCISYLLFTYLIGVSSNVFINRVIQNTSIFWIISYFFLIGILTFLLNLDAHLKVQLFRFFTKSSSNKKLTGNAFFLTILLLLVILIVKVWQNVSHFLHGPLSRIQLILLLCFNIYLTALLIKVYFIDFNKKPK